VNLPFSPGIIRKDFLDHYRGDLSCSGPKRRGAAAKACLHVLKGE
jgi:hypothetical protein